MKNQRGHWVCWTSTSKKNVFMWRTHTAVQVYIYTSTGCCSRASLPLITTRTSKYIRIWCDRNAYIWHHRRLLSYLRFFFFLSIPFVIFAPLFSLPPSRNADRGSLSRLFSPPTHYGSCLAICFVLFARIFDLFLPSSTRVELCLPTVGALSSWSFFFFFMVNKFKTSPWWNSNSQTNTIKSSIRGLPLVHRGDRLTYRLT